MKPENLCHHGAVGKLILLFFKASMRFAVT